MVKAAEETGGRGWVLRRSRKMGALATLNGLTREGRVSAKGLPKNPFQFVATGRVYTKHGVYDAAVPVPIPESAPRDIRTARRGARVPRHLRSVRALGPHDYAKRVRRSHHGSHRVAGLGPERRSSIGLTDASASSAISSSIAPRRSAKAAAILGCRAARSGSFPPAEQGPTLPICGRPDSGRQMRDRRNRRLRDRRWTIGSV